jgi:hypothetical protein
LIIDSYCSTGLRLNNSVLILAISLSSISLLKTGKKFFLLREFYEFFFLQTSISRHLCSIRWRVFFLRSYPCSRFSLFLGWNRLCRRTVVLNRKRKSYPRLTTGRPKPTPVSINSLPSSNNTRPFWSALFLSKLDGNRSRVS